MKLPFLDREGELRRLRRLLSGTQGSFGVLYGRRRCGKSRLLLEALSTPKDLYHVADEREATVQRAALARTIATVLPGFDRATYADWDALFARWWESARPGAVLVLDEFPALVASEPELPSILQKFVDRPKGPHLVLSGSSQRMMQGLVLARNAPLYGRAGEILRIGPLPAGWIRSALPLRSDEEAVEAYAVWGGIPRYWELSAEYPERIEAIRSLLLDPLGVLHDEPSSLLLDDVRELTQSATLLAIIGQGAHRLSEIASRAGKPATSLSRPFQRLLELGFVRRDLPFGTSTRDTKRSLYRIADPFLRFWFRFVDPNRSRLQSGEVRAVSSEVEAAFAGHVSTVWEDLARESLAQGSRWTRVASWWGSGMEVDVVAESADGKSVLIGETEWSEKPAVGRLADELRLKATRLPPAAGRKIHLGLWLKRRPRLVPEGVTVYTPTEVLAALR